jgi:SAM-dependent methyltransferase
VIERRIEAVREIPDYQGRQFSEDEIARDRHRVYVGGLWGRMGRLQRDFLVEHGLEPSMRFLDVGCGAFRAGRHLVDYLEPGQYYGIDINADVVEAGYREELTDEQRARLPLANLRITDRFDADFGVGFDMAIAQSVFTHVSLNHIRLCLFRVAQVMKPGGRFYATFHERPASYPIDGARAGRWGGSYTERNEFWYYRRDLRWAAERTPFTYRYLGDWGQPRGQKMVEYVRIPDPDEC